MAVAVARLEVKAEAVVGVVAVVAAVAQRKMAGDAAAVAAEAEAQAQAQAALEWVQPLAVAGDAPRDANRRAATKQKVFNFISLPPASLRIYLGLCLFHPIS